MTTYCMCGADFFDEGDALQVEDFDWGRVGYSLGASGATDAFEELERGLDGNALHELRIAFSRGKRARQSQKEIDHAQA